MTIPPEPRPLARDRGERSLRSSGFRMEDRAPDRDEDDRDRDEPDRRWGSWMIAAQDGDAATYEKLLRELLPYVRLQVTGRFREPAAREDIVRNVLISLHHTRHTYRPEHPFAPWLQAIVANASIAVVHDASIGSVRGAQERMLTTAPSP